METRERLAAERYRLLLSQMRGLFVAEHGGKEHGWMKWASGKLHIRPEHVRLLLDESRSAGGKIIERAIRHYVHNPDFFYDAKLRSPDHRDFLRKAEALPAGEQEGVLYAPMRPAAEGLEESDERALWELLGSGSRAPVSNEEIEQLRTWAARTHRKGGLARADFEEALDLMRRGGAHSVAERERTADDGDPRTAARRRVEELGGMKVRKGKP